MSDAVTRLNAALQGRYRIERELGAGGMATVYLARDEKHNRNVALKVLKPELAALVGAERFLAEIETTANLQHPHILPLFDSGEADGFLFYVMPYVEGETLRDRLDRVRQLPVDEAVSIAKAVAQALQHAHDRGVIHRDIKPGNILIQDGQPVVSDFGIALAVGAGGGARLTETGLSVGTPYYMSPEQATGDVAVGPATDIYALGCVLYEMLIGDPPYIGSSAQAVLGKIIQGTPVSATGVRKSVPPHVDAAIRRALEKLPADRFASAQDFAKALGDQHFQWGGSAAASVGSSGRPAWRPVALALGGVVVGLVVATVWSSGSRSEGPRESLVRFTIDPPETLPFIQLPGIPDVAISPDGRLMIYMGLNAARSGTQLNVRALDQPTVMPLRGGENGGEPFFSPDGAWVGFVDAGTRLLRKVSSAGGAVVDLIEAPTGIFGASWGPDDRIVFGTQGGGLFQVSAEGGEAVALTSLGPDEQEHLWPAHLEGEQAVVFVVNPTGGTPLADGQLAVLDLESGEIAQLGVQGTSPRYVSTGHLLYAASDGSLRAVPFDPRSREVTGSPVPLVESVATGVSGAADYSVSRAGRLVYAGGAPPVDGPSPWQLVWVDREGREDALPVPTRPYTYPRVSPDGRTVAVSVLRRVETDDAQVIARDLWVYDVLSGAGQRLTYDDELNQVPIWTPDGSRILFSSTRDAPRPASYSGGWLGNVYSVPADGSGPAQRMTTSEDNQVLTGIAPDRRALYTKAIDGATHWEIMMLPTDGSGEPRPLVTGPFRRGSGDISPDGRWLAYRSDETGEFEIYVQPFPGPGARVPVSIGGGDEPVWSADSRELFYLGADDMMMAATISGTSAPQVTERRALFSAGVYRRAGGNPRQYHVAPDGRFLMMRVPGLGEDASELTVVLNWFEELRERVPVD
jgi:serine/threonine protein kinase